jgi:hypothetical protein
VLSAGNLDVGVRKGVEKVNDDQSDKETLAIPSPLDKV